MICKHHFIVILALASLATPAIAQSTNDSMATVYADSAANTAANNVGIAAREESSRMDRQFAEHFRQVDNQNFFDGWANVGMANLQRIGMANAALAACRKAAGGCNSRFVAPPGAHPGPAFIAGKLAKSPAEKQELAATAARALQNYGAYAARLGLPQQDMAGPMAFSLLVAMDVYHGKTPAISPALAQRVVAQARPLLANNGSIALASNAERLRSYEVNAIIGVYLYGEFVEGQRAGDGSRLARAKGLAAQQVKALTGLAPEQIAVTAGGIVQTGAKAPTVKSNGLELPSGGYVAHAATTTRFAGSGGALNPANAAALSQFNQLMQQRGGDTNDLAWASAGYFAVNYAILRGTELTQRQLAGAAQLARQRILQTDAGAQLDDRSRQQAYERFAVDSVKALSEFSDYVPGGRYSQDQYTASQGIKFHRDLARRRLEDMVAPASLNDLSMTPDGPVIGGQ